MSEYRFWSDDAARCSVCNRDLGKKFDVQVKMFCGERVLNELRRQCTDSTSLGKCGAP